MDEKGKTKPKAIKGIIEMKIGKQWRVLDAICSNGHLRVILEADRDG